LDTDDIDAVIAAIRGGLPALLPTDTVYGLVTSAYREDHAARIYRLKGREDAQPSALLAGSIDVLFESVPELVRGRAEAVVRELLPGPYTLILPNPARRYRWLNGVRVDAIGVRVPNLPPEAQSVLDAVGCVVSTSANDPGGRSPATIEEVPARIRAGVAATLDIGRLPGTPSTVIDFTGEDPYVIREGAASSAEAIARVRSALPA
jgi:L-threonylcarbamoyladenylate synthase